MATCVVGQPKVGGGTAKHTIFNSRNNLFKINICMYICVLVVGTLLNAHI